MTDVFFASELKVDRAKFHLSTLQSEIDKYIESNPFKVVVEQDETSSNHKWTLRVSHDIPFIFAAIIGDIIHNLRASLDLLAAQAVIHNGGNPKDVYFPFSHNEESLDEMIKKRKIKRAGDHIVDLIKNLQPYKGGNEKLREIHDLDITDKHKTLIPVAHYAGIENFEMLGASGPVLMIKNLKCGPIRDGMVIMSLPPAQNIQIGHSFQPKLSLTLENELPGSDLELNKLMETYINLVEAIINNFKEAIE